MTHYPDSEYWSPSSFDLVHLLDSLVEQMTANTEASYMTAPRGDVMEPAYVAVPIGVRQQFTPVILVNLCR